MPSDHDSLAWSSDRIGLREFTEALLSVDSLSAERLFLDQLETSEIGSVVEDLISPALHSIGERWDEGELALSQVYMSGRICEQLVDRHLPRAGFPLREAPRLGIAVFEDYHMLGKRIVYSMLRSAGYAVRDYGHGIGTETLLRKAEEDRLEVLLLSVLMLRSALRIREVVETVKKRGLPMRVVVGGAPFRFDSRLADEIGADAFGTRASDALDIVARFATGGAK